MLVDTLAASIRSVVPGVRLVPSDAYRHTCQFYADDVVLLSESQIDLQAGLDACHAWGIRWRFIFGVGPTKSAAMVFGPARSRPDCRVHLGGVPLPVVTQYRYLGVVLTPELSWRAHDAHVFSRGDRLFHQSSAWCHGEGLPVRFAVSVFDTYVLSSACFGLEFVGDDSAAIAKFNLALHRWCRQLLGWPRASPIAAIHWEVGIGDSLRLVLSRAFPLFGRLCALDPAGSRSPLPAMIFRLCAKVRGTWAHWCASALRSLSVLLLYEFGISTCSPPVAVARWCSREVPVRLDRDFHHRLAAMAADPHGVGVDITTDLRLPVPRQPSLLPQLPVRLVLALGTRTLLPRPLCYRSVRASPE